MSTTITTSPNSGSPVAGLWEPVMTFAPPSPHMTATYTIPQDWRSIPKLELDDWEELVSSGGDLSSSSSSSSLASTTPSSSPSPPSVARSYDGLGFGHPSTSSHPTTRPRATTPIMDTIIEEHLTVDVGDESLITIGRREMIEDIMVEMEYYISETAIIVIHDPDPSSFDGYGAPPYPFAAPPAKLVLGPTQFEDHIFY
ncbi:hypothetical protein C8Q75DRAFT_730090 [Abortiporus biennis]|nr:hypothetical protein C8Q75DRAFT_730090 [Abortiporus biennis]